MASNLPPGVTQGMIDDHFDDPCEDCDDYDECQYDHDRYACETDKAVQAAEDRYDAMTDR